MEIQWEHFEHEADIGVRGRGPTLAAAFEQAALALTAVVTDPAGVYAMEAVPIACAAPDDELLLADWLNALIYTMSTRKLLFGRYEVAIEDHRLRATAWGEPVDLVRHQPAVEIKGATYTQLAVRREADGSWIAQCVVDV
jgi:tRNA nucleotidyltransferase (CCA-adding enzyme)